MLKSSSNPYLLQLINALSSIICLNALSPTALRMNVSCEKTRSTAALDVCTRAMSLTALEKHWTASLLS